MFINSMLMLNDNILLFGIWLIDVNAYQIIYEIDIKPFSFCRCDALKLSNGNILFITDFEKSGEYSFISNNFIKVKNYKIVENNVIENKNGEIITYNNFFLKVWKK